MIRNDEKRSRVRAWVDALRSGKYEQTQNVLQDADGGYCCLGVACQLYALDHPEAHWTDEPDYGNGREFQAAPRTQRRDTMPPPRVRDAFSLSPVFAGDLASANDRGETFAEIADRIETALLD